MAKMIKNEVDSKNTKKRILNFISSLLTIIGVLGLLFAIGLICSLAGSVALAIYICILLIILGYLLDQEEG